MNGNEERNSTMRKLLLVVLAATLCASAHAQGTTSRGTTDGAPVFFYRSAQGTGGAAVAVNLAGKGGGAPVEGAPYSATIVNETVQTLADGNRIVLNATGEIARDSQGRTRQQMELPAIGNLAAANPPRIVFIQDPVAQIAYTLNLTDKTAQKMPNPPLPPGPATAIGGPGPNTVVMIGGVVAGAPVMTTGGGPIPPPLPPPPSKGMLFTQNTMFVGEPGQTATEDLGSQTMEGVLVNGTRTTLTIPAGQIGNDQPIKVVTEMWTSPYLKAIVYSKRNDPRMGEQTFRLTQVSRNEPDLSLFTVPADFKIVDGPQPVIYAPKQ